MNIHYSCWGPTTVFLTMVFVTHSPVCVVSTLIPVYVCDTNFICDTNLIVRVCVNASLIPWEERG